MHSQFASWLIDVWRGLNSFYKFNTRNGNPEGAGPLGLIGTLAHEISARERTPGHELGRHFPARPDTIPPWQRPAEGSGKPGSVNRASSKELTESDTED